MIQIPSNAVPSPWNPPCGHAIAFSCVDRGDLYSAMDTGRDWPIVPGTVVGVIDPAGISPNDGGSPDDRVRVFARELERLAQSSASASGKNTTWKARGFVRDDSGCWKETLVSVVSIRESLFDRTRGLLETDALAGPTIFVPGVGSVGSYVGLEAAKAGVTNFILMDHQRIEVPNVIRHIAGITDIGRRKVNVVAEAIRSKNPCASVETCSAKVTWATQDMVRIFVRKSDLVICGLDDPEGRVILNKICVEEGKPIIFAGAFRRAYGGQILLVRPHETPCYQCFLRRLPEQARDQEISSQEDADRLAYSDRPVPVEPGLSNDIAPISQMVVKLAIQHLLKGKATTFRSLDEDLVASWYLWINRREKDTDYEQLKPLGFNVGGFHILRWYGIDVAPDPECPCCGDFMKSAAKQEIRIGPEGAVGCAPQGG
ncbi:MAG: ThiF family adenylyltransferase [Planctomycetota bacterium]|nr:ThiF family adenylyltransferase [Planctomycetota bacterium]